MDAAALQQAISTVPTGRYAVGVSGGADSVALLRLCSHRRDLSLHVVHLDHELRGEESRADSRFVESLAQSLGLPCSIATRRDIEPNLPVLPPNPSARYRAGRLALFRQVVRDYALDGLLLAHHADDQAETVFLKLLRGVSTSLSAMQPKTDLGGLLVHRPLLGILSRSLRSYLRSIDQAWREDSSNRSDAYARNLVRQWLGDRQDLQRSLIQLADHLDALQHWIRSHAPDLAPEFRCRDLADLPQVLADSAARRWLMAHGAPPDQIAPRHLAELRRMAQDMASPNQAVFPGNRTVRRRGGAIGVKP